MKKINGENLIVVVKWLIEELISELTFFIRSLLAEYFNNWKMKKPSTSEQRVEP